jgi:hypothetical protein
VQPAHFGLARLQCTRSEASYPQTRHSNAWLGSHAYGMVIRRARNILYFAGCRGTPRRRRARGELRARGLASAG